MIMLGCLSAAHFFVFSGSFAVHKAKKTEYYAGVKNGGVMMRVAHMDELGYNGIETG